MAKEDELDRLIREVDENLRNDPCWQVKSKNRDWICPYCGEVGVFRSRRSRLTGDVINHLRLRCQNWNGGRGALLTLAQVRAAVRTRSIRTSRATKSYARAQTLRIAVARRLGDAFRPASQVSAQAQKLQEELLELKERLKGAQALDESLDQAREIVSQMLPEEVPIVGDIDLSFGYRPSLKIGGDFYDFINAGDDRVGILVGDVAGHGLDAALIMSMAKKALVMRGADNPSPGDALRAANVDVFQELGDKSFVTVFYAVVDARKNTLSFARAGHNEPIVYSPDLPAPFGVLKSAGIGLGIDPGPLFDQRLEEKTVPLTPGSIVAFYTDGITEAMNASQTPFKIDGLCSVIQQCKDASSEQIVSRVFDAVQKHLGGVDQEDDMALICLKTKRPDSK